MTTVNPDIDLGGFARKESVAVPRPKRRWTRIVVPAVILLGFVVVLLSSLGDLLSTAIVVTVVRPVPWEGPRESGAVLFQAAGWVEPDPWAVRVTPLASGVVQEVLVQPSDPVTKGQTVATLVADDAKLALAAAEAAVTLAEAEREQARAEAETATRSLAAALEVTEALESSRAEAAGRDAARRASEAAVQKGQAQVRIAEEELALQRYLAGEKATGPRQVELAEARLAEAQGELEIQKAAAALAAAEAAKAGARLRRAEKEFELRFEPRLRVATSTGALAAAEARVRDAEVKRAEARLRLDRMTVAAPGDGVVLARLATPGLRIAADAAEPAAICTLFDPLQVRVRVDVPQDRVGKAHAGQPALIFSEARRDQPYHGRVLRVVQEADVNKVTLQVHVRITDPDALLRPEMLCQVRFLSSGTEGSSAPAAAVRAPARLLVDGRAFWIVDAVTGQATLRRVQASPPGVEWVEVLSGLDLSDKLIDDGRNQVQEGTRVRVREGK